MLKLKRLKKTGLLKRGSDIKNMKQRVQLKNNLKHF